MTLIPEIHDALSRAVGARRASRRRAWRVSLLALGGVVFAGSAIAATAGWRPVLGSDRGGHPSVSASGVPADQLAALAVLRRPQTDADRGPDVRAILRFLGPEGLDGVHTDGIRLLRRHGDGVTILLPSEKVGRHDEGYPSSIKRRVLCVMTSMRGGLRVLPRGRPAAKPAAASRGLTVGGTCGTLRDLKTRGIGAGWMSGDDLINARLVPDGVAKVVVRLRGGREITATVRDNVYAVNTGKELAPGWGLRWLDAQGRRIEHRRAHVPG